MTIAQIELFKFICRSDFSTGFTLVGDTAQSITSGVNFRFEYLKRAFYERFELEHPPKVFPLTQNYRTHDGVLRGIFLMLIAVFKFIPSG